MTRPASRSSITVVPTSSGRIGSAVLCVAAALLASCGSDGVDVSTPAPESRATTTIASAVSSTVAPTAPQTDLDGFSGELILTRQRDLLDRGLINVMTSNESAHDLFVTDRELVASHFRGEPAAPRNSTLPRGRRIAVQVPYGVANDCESEEPVQAEFRFTFTTPDHPEPQVASIDVGGTAILDGIRARQCATQRFDAETSTSFAEVVTDGETIETILRVERAGGESDFTFERASGTVLVGAARTGGTTTLFLGPTDRVVDIPITFVVNRCDPHAMAEVTKRYGLDLEIGIDGSDVHAVPIDVSPLVDELAAAVERCRERTES